MARKRFDEMPCSIAQTLNLVGDWWTLLIIRDAFFGARRFAEFETRLGIAKNILANRLSQLVDNGIMRKVDIGQTGTHYAYELTEKGRDLFPVLTALRQWGDKWVYGEGCAPMDVIERKSGRPLARMLPLGADGEPVALGALEIRLKEKS